MNLVTPSDVPIMPYPEHVPFVGRQPIDPYTIGVRAPYEAVEETP